MKKGVYMDSHERLDVVEYRDNVFLPLMASFERCMAQWKPEGPGLVHVKPDLRLGESGSSLFFRTRAVFMLMSTKQQFGVHLLPISVWHYLH